MKPPTLLHEVLAWGRANGWRHSQEWLESSRDADGAPWDEGTMRHRWTREFSNGERHAIDAYIKVGGSLTLVAYQPDDSDDTGMFWGGRSIRQYGLSLVLDGLAAAEVIPLGFSSAYKTGHRDGYEEGADSVTEMSVMSLVDVELDKLETDANQAELADRIRHLLATEDPYDIRVATKEIVEAVWNVMDRPS